MIQIPAYKRVVFEPLAYRDAGKSQKAVFARDKSFWGLRGRGFSRHPFMREWFSLVCDGLEGKLSDAEKQVFNDSRTGRGEFFNEVLLTDGKDLFVYDDAEDLVFT